MDTKVRQLKNIEMGYSLTNREFYIYKAGDEVKLTRAEAGALQRFIFSMFQFYSKKYVKANR